MGCRSAGRSNLQMSLQGKVRAIALNLHKHCVEPDQGERLRKTGSLSPKGSLRFKAGRQAFKWCERIHEPRYFTKTAVKGALKLLLDKYEVEVPFGESERARAQWLMQQSRVVQHLCKRAVKNALAPPRPKCAPIAMDEAETQPWAMEDVHTLFLEKCQYNEQREYKEQFQIIQVQDVACPLVMSAGGVNQPVACSQDFGFMIRVASPFRLAIGVDLLRHR